MAQPDFIVEEADRVLCFESKLTQCEAGRLQISQLYRPLLRHIFGLPVVGVLVCRNITTRSSLEIRDLLDLEGLLAEEVHLWHFLG